MKEEMLFLTLLSYLDSIIPCQIQETLKKNKIINKLFIKISKIFLL